MFYWLAKRQWRCLAAFAVFSAGLVAITIALCGMKLWLAYLDRSPANVAGALAGI